MNEIEFRLQRHINHLEYQLEELERRVELLETKMSEEGE